MTLFDLLYDEDEYTCFAWRYNDTSVLPVRMQEEQRSPWISLNPLYGDMDNDPETSLLLSARSDRGRRADINVSTFRNFLVEMDEVPLKKQWPIIRDCGLPFSTSVFSGNKSIHFVISLADPCVDKIEYDVIAQMIYRAVPAKIDYACKIPSHLTRNPEIMRTDTKKEQRLLELRKRVSKQEILNWTESRGVKPHDVTAPPKDQKFITGQSNLPPQWVINFLYKGAPDSARNNSAFKAACVLAECGMDENEINEKFKVVPGLIKNTTEQRQITMTIKSACRRVFRRIK
jgi:hypothetical protein